MVLFFIVTNDYRLCAVSMLKHTQNLNKNEKEPLNIGKLLSLPNHSKKDYDLMRKGAML